MFRAPPNCVPGTGASAGAAKAAAYFRTLRSGWGPIFQAALLREARRRETEVVRSSQRHRHNVIFRGSFGSLERRVRRGAEARRRANAGVRMARYVRRCSISVIAGVWDTRKPDPGRNRQGGLRSAVQSSTAERIETMPPPAR